MSQTYSIGCIDCKVELWIGQCDYIYNSELHNLSNFLFDHVGHNLKFVNDMANDAADNDWSDFEDYEVLPLGKQRTKLLQGNPK